MKKLFTPALILAAGMFAYAPTMSLDAPYESTMGLVQKIFYYHAPVGIVMFVSTFTCGFASLAYLVRGKAKSDRLAEAAPDAPAVSSAAVPFVTEALRWLPGGESVPGVELPPVVPGRASARALITACAAFGASGDSPRAAARIPRCSSSGSRSFNR